MAKSKLAIQVELRLRELKTTLKDVEKELEADRHLTPRIKNQMEDQFIAFAKASDDLNKHLAKLKEREGGKSVPDRLRNLKNVFKNKEALSQKREQTRHQYEDLEKKIQKYKAGVIAAVNSQSPKEGMRQRVAEIEKLEAEAKNLGPAVDTIEAVLV